MKIGKYFSALALLLFSFSIYEGKSQGFTNTVISLTGKVISSQSSAQPKVSVTILDNEGKKVASAKTVENKDGFTYFLTGLKPNADYTVSIQGQGFFSQIVDYKTPNTNQYVELSKDFVIQPMEVGYPILVKVAPFDINKSTIRNGSDYIFEDYLSILKNNPRARFEISAYPDNNRDSNFNKSLTEERATALKEYFVQAGIPKMRLSTKSFDETDPKNPPPSKFAKGKRYVGPIYLVVTSN